jgi:hypothetical protein
VGARASRMVAGEGPRVPRKTFVAGGMCARPTVGVVDFRHSGSELSVHSPSGISGAGGKKPLQQAPSMRFASNGSTNSESAADWGEADTLLSSRRMHVGAVQFSMIRGMFRSLITREQQLRFIHACSRDMSFNFVQARQLCKDRPEVIVEIVKSLFPAINGKASQLMLLSMDHLPLSKAANISLEVSPCLWFQPANLTGQYDLELEKPSHYAVAEGCLLINAWEAEISRALEYPDVSQRGNHEMFRNEVYNGAPFWYSREWALPSNGLWRFDFSSIRRPKSMKATQEATEVNRFLQRNMAPFAAKFRALRAISTHLYMSMNQFRNLIHLFPAGVLRQDLFCMFHTRVVDPVRFLGPELVYNTNIFSLQDRAALSERVGALHLLNPLHPEGVKYYCNLSVHEERMIVEFLVQLSTEEPGGKVMGAMGGRRFGQDVEFLPVPATWEKCVPSDEGFIVCSYETTSINMQWRQTLAQKYCIGLFTPHP